MHSAWTSGGRPFLAGTLTLKQCSRMHQNMPFSFKKLKIFWKGGPASSSDPNLSGRKILLSHLTPLGAYGASTLAPRRSTLGSPLPKSKYATGLICFFDSCLLDVDGSITVLLCCQTRCVIIPCAGVGGVKTKFLKTSKCAGLRSVDTGCYKNPAT